MLSHPLGEPSCMICTIREIVDSCVQIYNVLQGYFSLLPNVHSLNTGTVGPYTQIYDEELEYFYELAYIIVWTREIFLWNTFLYLRLRLYNDSGLPCTLEVVKQFV